MKIKSFVLGLITALVLCSLSISGPVYAGEAEEDDWDEYGLDEDSWDSFDDIADDLEPDDSLTTADVDDDSGFLYLSGFLKEDIGYSFSRSTPEVSKVKTTLNVTLDIDLFGSWKAKTNANMTYDLVYTLLGRDTFNAVLVDANESEVEARESFAEGEITDWLYLKTGWQVIAWGESDSAQIVDMANPRDMREPGLTDLEDARIPVLATKLTAAFDSWELNLAMISEFKPNKAPAEGSEFDILRSLRSNPMITLNDERAPDFQSEILARVLKRFNGGDLSLVFADTYDDSPYLAFEQFVYTINGLTPVPQLDLTPSYKRIQMIGLSGNIVSGAWLFKSDMALKSDMAISREDFQDQITAFIAGGPLPGNIYGADSGAVETWKEKDIRQVMLGVEYSGFADINLGIEAMIEQIVGYESSLASDELTGQIAMSFSHSALNDTLTTGVILAVMTDTGSILRITADYDIRDALRLSAGVILYEANDSTALLYPFRDADRLTIALRYSF